MSPEFGFAMAGAAGISLGLVGGGGGLLTVPILVYGFHLSMVLGTGYSLFVVGVTSLVGAALAFRRRRVDLPAALVFAAPSFLGILLSRTFILHRLPESFGRIGSISLSRDGLIMGVFGLVMIGAAFVTLRASDRHAADPGRGLSKPALLGLGLLVGALTGLFGAGGGFLIVPALVLGARLPMDRAIGTSLVIIAVNSLFGLLSDSHRLAAWNWPFLLIFTGVSLGGVLLGQALGGKFSHAGLKQAFAWFTFTVGLFIFLKELAQGVLWS